MFLQIGAGIALGLTIVAIMVPVTAGQMKEFNAYLVLPAVARFMLAVEVVAALGPARRGLAIPPSVVLKDE